MSQDLYSILCPFDKKFPSHLNKGDTFFMQLAYNQALDAWSQGEVPIGAVIVHNETLIAAAHNQVETMKDPTAHAEMIAITQTAQKLGDWRLAGCTLYVTKEPCPMCTGASMLARLDRVVFGAYDPKLGCMHADAALHTRPGFNHTLQVTPGVLEAECAQLLQSFFKLRREQELMKRKSLE